ncbi:flagellar basal-body MS-ring/collar protein FliF [Rhizorhapis suberifaciens]|uniref:Flagellar M-ring protein n=1 Tax=Rhizorhapis suberifaciens TaxID=13656 RepID=A0A840HY84_9SPHN|nr:flagellar basal-body MS-ring/collar protein FliF [Rhizorhapis suberifaciens]MBB4642468.1 flagellar M-ring protein FliF [Rhizorhapis suberifaciens]
MSETSLTIDNPPSPARNLPARSPVGGKGGFDDVRLRFQEFIRQPAVARSLPMIGMLAVVALAALAWLSLREPPQRDLFRGLPDSDKAAVAEALGASGIAFDLDDATGALTVSEDDYHKAKMALAAEGLPKSAPDGDSLINSLPMGASRAVEGEKLRSAREMDLARTIEAIDAIQSARVHLAVEQPSIFLRDKSKPAASVMLRLADGRALSDAQVQAIVHLVASSVPGLSPDGVSVVDQNGRLLSNPSDAGGSAETDRQIAVQSKVEERYRQAVIALLTPILGADNFSTEVHAELDFAESQATRETFPSDESRVKSEQGSWTSDKGEPPAYGIPGALANQAPPAATPGAQPADPAAVAQTAEAAAKTAENYVRNFELGREVSVTRNALGTVKRLSVAVALRNPETGKPRTPQEIASLEALVKGAVGFDQARGDVVALTARKFAASSEAEATGSWYEAGWVSMLARNLSALMVALALIFGIGRPLMKRRAAMKEADVGLSASRSATLSAEISQEISRAAVADPSRPVTLDMISSTQSYAERAALIRNFVKQDPDRAALVVRDLLRDSNRKEAVNA